MEAQLQVSATICLNRQGSHALRPLQLSLLAEMLVAILMQTTWLAAAVGSIGLGMGGIAIAAADQLPVSHIQKYFQGKL